MKTASTRFGSFAAFVAGFALVLPAISHAQREGDYNHDREGRHEEIYSHGKGGFELGVCAGQALAQQGITLPPPAQGQPYLNPGDASTQQALRSAVQTCREQFRTPPSGSPTPVPSESVIPSENPTAPSAPPVSTGVPNPTGS